MISKKLDCYDDFSELKTIVEGFDSAVGTGFNKEVSVMVQKSLLRNNPILGHLELQAFIAATQSFNGVEIVRSLRMITKLMVVLVALLIAIFIKLY